VKAQPAQAAAAAPQAKEPKAATEEDSMEVPPFLRKALDNL
jgi:hypothetical protein